MPKGTFFIIIGPTAVGKTAVVDALLTHIPRSSRLVTCTSRARRVEQGEVDGIHYHFLDRPTFERRIVEGDFLETNEYAGNLYGSSLKVLNDLLEQNVIVFAILDVNGARVVRERVPDAVTVFIAPSSFEELEQRVRARPDADETQVQKRLRTAREELATKDEFDHLVVNRDGAFDTTVEECMALVFPYQFWYPGRPPGAKA